MNYSNITKEEWQAIQSLANDRSIVIKKADTGSSVVIWDRVDYLKEANKLLSDKNVYKEIESKEKKLTELVETSNKFLRTLRLENVYQKTL